jgi:trimeric autotransporter adhesin
VGNGVLCITLGGATSAEQLTARDYQFALWDPSATTDMEALRHVFDTNKDGRLDSADHDWAAFRLLVTNADGTTTLETLGAANVASINLQEDHTRRQYADGSSIDGITTYTRTDGVVRTVASVSFAAEAGGTIVRTATSTATDAGTGTATTTIDNTQYATDGTRLWETRAATVIATATSNSVRTLSFDDTGDGIRAGGPFPAQAANDNNCYLRRACG